MAESNGQKTPSLAHPVGSQCHIPTREVLMRTLDPYQLACMAMSGVLSDEILDDEDIMSNIWFRTGPHLTWPYHHGPTSTIGKGCTHQMTIWDEGVKTIDPLHYFWLSHTGCLDLFYTALPRSTYAYWVAATVAPWHLPASFYELHGLDPETIYQHPPTYSHDRGYWRKMFDRLRKHDFPDCDHGHLETDGPEDPEVAATSDGEDEDVHDQDEFIDRGNATAV
ncbi:hypothetical protein IWZ03DRAFT_442563 [Phyllosticta citriasiana]|uniref:Uncharacterized protein n=1 Tax=Phyllosticta citriasiana TaxID=595635 RepID=A0ABR1KJ88_9PEZI